MIPPGSVFPLMVNYGNFRVWNAGPSAQWQGLQVCNSSIANCQQAPATYQQAVECGSAQGGVTDGSRSGQYPSCSYHRGETAAFVGCCILASSFEYLKCLSMRVPTRRPVYRLRGRGSPDRAGARVQYHTVQDRDCNTQAIIGSLRQHWLSKPSVRRLP